MALGNIRLSKRVYAAVIARLAYGQTRYRVLAVFMEPGLPVQGSNSAAGRWLAADYPLARALRRRKLD